MKELPQATPDFANPRKSSENGRNHRESSFFSRKCAIFDINDSFFGDRENRMLPRLLNDVSAEKTWVLADLRVRGSEF
jgi:hypothetical protein